MSVAFAAHSVCSPDPSARGRELGWGGHAGVGVLQGALGAVGCHVLSSSAAPGKSLTWGFDIGTADVSARVMFFDLFVRFFSGESRETPRARQ